MERREPARDREHTDQSLEQERTRTDDELATRSQESGETADAVIAIARDRARAVLATARAREDAVEPLTPELARKRAAADAVLNSEYAAADLALATSACAPGSPCASCSPSSATRPTRC